MPPSEWFGTTPYNGQIDASGRLWLVIAPRGIRYTDDGTTREQINLPVPLFGGPLWSDGAGTLWLSTLGKVPAGSPLWDAGSWKRTDSVQLRRNQTKPHAECERKRTPARVP